MRNEKTAWELLQEEFSCTHPYQEIRVKVHPTSRRYWMQCMHCGDDVEQVKKEHVYLCDVNPEDVPLFDEDLQTSYWNKREARRKQLWQECEERLRNREEEDSRAWWAKYSAYLQSPDWKMRRERVFTRERTLQKRDDPLCEHCWQRPGVQAHHTTYEHAFEARTWELKLVCLHCHEYLHGNRRSNGRP